MIKKKLEGFRFIEIDMQSFNKMLDDDIIKNYSHLEGVKKYKQTLLDHIEKLKHKREEVICLIEKIEDPLVREIFYMKYIEQKSHETIGREVGYSIPHLSRKFRKGIEDLEKLEG